MRTCFLGWLLATSAFTFSATARSQDTASIEGRVIAQATGAPLKNAAVKLRAMPAASDQRPTDRQLVQQTNEEGRFLFANVPGGDWELSAEKRGFVPGKYRASKYDPQGSRISVGRNDEVKDVVVKLVRQAVIAGRVVDNEGEPVEGARVAILKVGYAHGAPRWSEAASAVTLDNGEYRIPRVAPGRYLVRCGVVEDGSPGTEMTYAATYYPNVAEPSLAEAIEVRDDGTEISGIDLRIAPVHVFHVKGKFLAPSDRSPGQVLLVERSDPSKVFAQSFADPPDYLFDFSRVPPGSYVVWAFSMEREDFRASQLVEVKEQDVDILLSSAVGEISGSVKLKPGGRQVDLSALSVEIWPIWLEGFDHASVPRPLRLTGDLRFRYPVLSRLFVSFAVRIFDLPEGCYVASVRYGGRDVPDSGIEYSTGAALEITIGSDGARVDGKTLDKDDNPWDGAVVALISTDGNSEIRSVKSGSRGAFQFTGVPPGDYQLLAFDDAGRDDLGNPDFVKRFDGQARAVKLAASGAATVPLRVIAPEPAR